ncbi:MAG: DUF5034 domain-containing protein, partial [Chitinophagia bacterium]|nr:DUF5034 domain-containing protein [Chitinophagia bacterium]
KLLFLALTAIYFNVLLVLLHGCRPKNGPRCNKITSIHAVAFNNADSLPVTLAPGATVSSKAFMLRLLVTDTLQYCATTPLSLLSSAHAEYAPRIWYDTVDSIGIFADRDFDELHPAGSNLRQLFLTGDTTTTGDRRHFTTRNFYLNATPDSARVYTFTIHVWLNRHTQQLTSVSTPVRLL